MRVIHEFLDNQIFFIVLFAWLTSCLLKGLIEICRTRRIDWGRFFGPGGMPSSHSTIVSSLAACVGIYEGFDSPLFVVCCAMALIVMYDASGVRRAAGEHAKIINIIIEAWEEAWESKNPFLSDEKLKEILGHTPLQVAAGAVLGVVFSIIACAIVGA